MDIATSVNKIGEIVNLSQELNTIMWDAVNSGKKVDDIHKLYCDIAQLDVMSNIEIDSAKKEYPVNNRKEISELKEKYMRVDDKTGKRIMPNFFMPISRRKGYYDPNKKSYVSHKSTMDYLQKAMRAFRRDKSSKLEFMSFQEVLNPEYRTQYKCNYDQIDRVINIVEATKSEIDSVWADSENYDSVGKRMASDDLRQICVDYVQSVGFNATTMYVLLNLLEDEKYAKISRTLFSILFGSPNKSFFGILDASRQPIDFLEEDPRGEIQIYDFRFNKTKKTYVF